MRKPKKLFTGPTWNKTHQVFFIKYQTLDGRRSTKNVPAKYRTEEDAAAWAEKAIVYYRNTGRWRDAATTVAPATIRSLHEGWLKYRKTHPKTSANTWSQLDSNMRIHILTHAIADKPIAAITPKVLRAWVQEMRTGVAANTAKNIAASLTKFFRDARAEGWVELATNPMKDEIVREEIPEGINVAGKGVLVHVPSDDFITLVHSPSPLIPSGRRVRHLFAGTTGAREGEINGLTWRDVKLKDAIPNVVIERQYTAQGELVPPKRGSHRTLPLHALTVAALDWWRKEGWEAWTGRPPTDDDPVFGSEMCRHYRPQSARYLRQDLGSAGVPTHYKDHPIDAHALRRSFATMLADARVPADERGILMGHASKTVTDRHYTARNLPRFADAIGKLEVGGFGWKPFHPSDSPFHPKPGSGTEKSAKI